MVRCSWCGLLVPEHGQPASNLWLGVGDRQDGGGQGQQPQGHGQRRRPRRARHTGAGRDDRRVHQGVGITHLGPRLRDGEGARGQVNGIGSRTEIEQAQARIAVHQVLEQACGLVSKVADAVLIGVETGVIAPIVAAAILLPQVPLELAAALNCHLLGVFPEDVVPQLGVAQTGSGETGR